MSFEEHPEFLLDNSLFTTTRIFGTARFGHLQIVNCTQDLGAGNEYLQEIYNDDGVTIDPQKYFIRSITFFFKIPPFPSIHKFFGYTLSPNSLILQNHTTKLSQLFRAQRSDKPSPKDQQLFNAFTPTCRAKTIFGIIAGIFHLHSFGHYHRAINPDNIYLNEKLEPIISEFGFTKDAVEPQLTELLNKFFYQAPETFINGTSYDFTVDIYSLSMVIYELIAMKIPFTKEGHPNLRREITENNLRPDTTGLPADIVELLEKCWIGDPSKRYTTSDLLIFFYRRPEPLFTGVNEEEYHEYMENLISELNIDEETMRDLKSPHITEETRANFQNLLSRTNESQDPQLLSEVGRMYYKGIGTSININKAIEYYQLAAEKNHALSMFQLARIYQEGVGIQQNLELAAQYSKQAGEAGLVMAKIEYGVRLLMGNGCPKDVHQALNIFKELADPPSSHKVAMYYYGMTLLQPPVDPETGDRLIDEDTTTGKKYLIQSANQDYMPSKMQHAAFLMRGQSGFSQDVAQALRIYQQAATQNVPLGLANIGYCYEKGGFPGYDQDYKKAIDYYQKAIQSGCKEAMTRYALLLDKGVPGILDQNKIRAGVLFGKAADKGDKLACHNYASHLIEHDDDVERAISYYKLAGFPVSYKKIGEIYLNGLGIDRDVAQARIYFEKGAKLGNQDCRTYLADMEDDSVA